MQPYKQLEKDADKLEAQQVRSESYTEAIIREQIGLIDAAQTGIEKLNSDLKALRKRLTVYAGSKPKSIDEKYSDLKHRYTYKLEERAVLQNALNMAEESITAAKLHYIPGEDTRA